MLELEKYGFEIEIQSTILCTICINGKSKIRKWHEIESLIR